MTFILYPNEFIPDDGHNICLLCLCVQDLKEVLTDPWPHCSLLPLSERQLRFAGLRHIQDAVVLPLGLALQQKAKKKHAFVASSTPRSKKPSLSSKPYAGHLLSKRVACLSSDMMEINIFFTKYPNSKSSI